VLFASADTSAGSVQAWVPFRLQFYFNGHNALAAQLKKADIAFEQVDNAFLHIADFEKANELSAALDTEALHRRLNQLAEQYCPLVRERYAAKFFHGEDGMGNMNYPSPKNPPAEGHAVDVLIDAIKANPGIMLVTLGPMTNVAVAVSKAPEIISNVSRCIVMGGTACTVGNITPAAEYNIWCDPEAVSICFRSGLPIEMVGWELCRGEANLFEEDTRYFKQVINTPLSNFVVDCNVHALKVTQEWFGEPGIDQPDPVAMAIAIDPTKYLSINSAVCG